MVLVEVNAVKSTWLILSYLGFVNLQSTRNTYTCTYNVAYVYALHVYDSAHEQRLATMFDVKACMISYQVMSAVQIVDLFIISGTASAAFKIVN